MSHITGGGITGNLPRAFAKSIAAVVDTQGWKRPAIFDWLQEKGGVEQDEMWRVFNCGVGFVLIVPRLQADAAMASLKQSGAKRSEERRVGKECVRTCSFRWSPYN